MKAKISIIIFMLAMAVYVRGQSSDLIVTWNYSGSSFYEFVTTAESTYRVRFFYKSQWVNDLVIPDLGVRPLLADLLTSLFRGKNLHYFVDRKGNFIITRDYRIRPFMSDTLITEGFLPQSDYSDQTEHLAAGSNLVYEIGNPAEKERAGNASITGYVRDVNSGDALVGVNIFIEELARGTTTDGNGLYLVNIPRGSYNIKFSYLGMKETSINARIFGKGRLDIEMAEVFIPIEGAVITARKSDMLRRMETGLDKVNMATFRLMPTTLGEADVLKNILLLPGVKTVGEASQGYNVRGGASDQNLILLYGAPLFNPSHFFGFFTSVNSDIIKDMSLYKGGIPSRYGGRLSSVLDIIPRDGSMKEFGGNAGISPIATHVLIDLPLIRDKLSALIAARNTYSDWIMDIIDYPLLKKSKASFYDINLRVTMAPDNKNRLELSGYQSHDSFRLNSDTTYNYRNRIATLKWSSALSDKTEFSVSTGVSTYDYDITSLAKPLNTFELNYSLNNGFLISDMTWSPGKINKINCGINMSYYSVLPGNYQPAGDSSLIQHERMERNQALESAVYIEDRLNFSDKISASIGLRYSLYSVIGPGHVRIYEPNLPRSRATIYDTIFFDRNSIYKTYSGPEFRISFNYMISDARSVKLNYNRTRQYLHLLTNSISISPTDIWKLCDYYVEPQVADHFSAGYYLTILWNNLELSGEIYYKPIRNMIDFKGGSVITMNESIEKDIINVEGRAYGAEFMLRKSVGKTTWHLSYTYSRILLRSRSPYKSEEINSGKWFPASYDKPHDLSLSLNYIATRRLSLSLTYVYNTGRPITYPVGAYQNANLWLIQYSDRNKYRIPDYSRLDLSVRLKGNLKSKKLMNPCWTFSCYNVLGRDNVYSEYFLISNNKVNAYRLSVFARPVPTLVYSFDF